MRHPVQNVESCDWLQYEVSKSKQQRQQYDPLSYNRRIYLHFWSLHCWQQDITAAVRRIFF